MSIAGIVLAAGASRRMGTAKSLLKLDGCTFVEHCVLAMMAGGCDPVVVVVGTGPEHEEAARLAEGLGARTAVNPDAGSQQIDSLRLALHALPADTAGAAVTPVDIPEVSSSLVRALRQAFESTNAPVTVPVRDGRHGHPVIFARRLFAELLHSELPDGARGVVHAYLEESARVIVSELAEDVDTPGDLERLRGRR